MQNYWLADFKEAKASKATDDEESPDSGDPEVNQDKIKADLSERQAALYEAYEQIAEDYGEFDQGAKANGAHYSPAKKNPFKTDGLVCSNCAFYMGNGTCEIVSGTIESDGICKLWVIPQSLIKKK